MKDKDVRSKRAMFIGRSLAAKWAAFLLALPVFCGFPAAAHAQRIYMDINKATVSRIAIAVPELKRESPVQPEWAGEMASLLGKDLDFSGAFRVLDSSGFAGDPQSIGVMPGEIDFASWKKMGSDYLVRGTYTPQGAGVRLQMRLYDAVSGNQILGKEYDGAARDWQGMIHKFADEIIYALTGEHGAFGTRIAYVQTQGQNKEIFVADFNGANPVQVTHDGSIALSPAWSRDGSQLAYTSYRDGFPKIYAVNVASGARRLLFGMSNLNITPAWKPGGGALAITLSMGGSPGIYLVSDSGSIISKLVNSSSIDVSPSWSPDGARLAYVSSESGNPQIYVLDVASGQKRRLTYQGSYNTSPRWSPKGDSIAFNGMAGGRHNIFVMKADGGGAQQLTGEGNNEGPTWSPDGRLIAFSSTRDGSSAIWVMTVADKSARRLTASGGGQILPDWSPRPEGQ